MIGGVTDDLRVVGFFGEANTNRIKMAVLELMQLQKHINLLIMHEEYEEVQDVIMDLEGIGGLLDNTVKKILDECDSLDEKINILQGITSNKEEEEKEEEEEG